MIQSRPPRRIAFTLFAYNQQGYIAEAVTSVLQKEDEPLHIILSDEASTDRTYEIMQDIVQAYPRTRICCNASRLNSSL